LRTKRFSQTILVRSLLVVVSLLYVISPLHSEFNILLHKISHKFTSEIQADENHIIKSIEKQHHHHNTVSEHELLVSNHNEPTIHNHNNTNNKTHKHEVITFFNSLFKIDSLQNNNEKDFIENKIDKHILTFNIELSCSFKEYEKKNLWYYYNLFKSLNSEIVIPPPQSSLS